MTRRGRTGLTCGLLLALLVGCGTGGNPEAPGDGQEAALSGEDNPASPPAVSSAELTFHPVLGLGEAAEVVDAGAFDPTQESTALDDVDQPVRIGPAALTKADVARASASRQDVGGIGHVVTVDFTAEGARAWGELTGAAACQPPGDPTRRVVIVLDGVVLSSPQVDPGVACDVGIQGGTTQITGDFTEQEAEDLAALLNVS